MIRMGAKKRSKYGAVRTELDGVTFASKAEARRYAELRLLERAGEIHTLTRQVPIDLLAVGGGKVGQYVADFLYFNRDGTSCAEDVKGCKTPLYSWKKRHVKAQYDIDIVEVR